MEPFYVFMSVAILSFRTSPLLLQLFGRILQNSRNVAWTTHLHLTFYPHEGEQIMIAFTFMGEPLTRNISKQTNFI